MSKNASRPLTAIAIVSPRPSERMSLDELLSIPFLNDILTRTLVYVDHLLEKDDRSKVEFFRQFASAIPQFSSKILRDKVKFDFS